VDCRSPLMMHTPHDLLLPTKAAHKQQRRCTPNDLVRHTKAAYTKGQTLHEHCCGRAAEADSVRHTELRPASDLALRSCLCLTLARASCVLGVQPRLAFRYGVADAVEKSMPTVVNVMVNARFHNGQFSPTYATQSVRPVLGKGVVGTALTQAWPLFVLDVPCSSRYSGNTSVGGYILNRA
jgi:hypothetical protein